MMHEDEIVNEIRQYRKAHAEKHGNDLNKIAQDFKSKQEASGKVILKRGPKLLSPKKVG
jgi:hypothetical protein